ncbi:MAG: hypothetical protein AAF378_13770 [Cyanobacteria bacterium P01_A01_bin.84]
MSEKIIWVQGDRLSPKNTVLEKFPGTPAIWVWDDALLNEWEISLKRIAFIYECLLELPVVIRRGDVAKEVLAFAKENGAGKVISTDSPSPRFDRICSQISNSMELEIYQVESFIDYDGFIDLKRFSRYWKVAQKYAFK